MAEDFFFFIIIFDELFLTGRKQFIVVAVAVSRGRLSLTSTNGMSGF